MDTPDEQQKLRERWVRDMRAFCDLIESRTDIPVPSGGIQCFASFVGDITEDEKTALATFAREFTPCDKEFGSFHIGIKAIKNKTLSLKPTTSASTLWP